MFLNGHKSMITNHLETLNKFLDLHSSKKEKMSLLWNFNFAMDEPHKSSCETHYLRDSIKKPTCY